MKCRKCKKELSRKDVFSAFGSAGGAGGNGNAYTEPSTKTAFYYCNNTECEHYAFLKVNVPRDTEVFL
jgi:hypothetical protein